MPKWSWDTFQDKWNEGFDYLCQFVEQAGDANVPQRFRAEDGFALGKWVSTQRTNMKNNKLTQDQTMRLEALPKWSWKEGNLNVKFLKLSWEDKFNYLKNFIKHEGHSRVKVSYEAEGGFKLGQWIGTQRRNKHKLTPDQIKKLEALPKWSWDVEQDKWNEAFDYLYLFAKQEGHSRVNSFHKTEDGFKLGSWVIQQRGKKHRLTPDQIKGLDALPKWSWDTFQDKWEDGFSQLLEYAEKNGDANVPQRFRAEDGFALGNWVSGQRSKTRVLTPDQIKRLEALPKWSWDPLTNKWNEGFDYLCQFVEKSGDARVPDSFKTEDGFALGSWVANKRNNKKNNKLTQDQIDQLEKLEGWVWDALGEKWKNGFSYLLQFVEKSGDARVPGSFKTEGGFALGSWVANKRNNKKNNKLTQDQIDQLEKLEGWVWDAKKQL